VDVSTVRYAADRCDPDVKWTDEACAKIVKVPRIFLGRVVKQITERAKEDGLTEITPEYMDKIRDKRAAEKE
ncbi:MAG: hypothetical protein ACTSP5_12415, partial [Candidatus Heimdallarchaeota archaeon]